MTALPRIISVDDHVVEPPQHTALERHQGLDCKGYTYESAMRIASNIVVYATLP